MAARADPDIRAGRSRRDQRQAECGESAALRHDFAVEDLVVRFKLQPIWGHDNRVGPEELSLEGGKDIDDAVCRTELARRGGHEDALGSGHATSVRVVCAVA